MVAWCCADGAGAVSPWPDDGAASEISRQDLLAGDIHLYLVVKRRPRNATKGASRYLGIATAVFWVCVGILVSVGVQRLFFSEKGEQQPITDAAPINVNTRNGVGHVGLQYTFARRMTVGDSLPVYALFTNADVTDLSHTVTVDTKLDAATNCAIIDETPTSQLFPPQSGSRAFSWTVTADRVGQCLLTFRTTFHGFTNADLVGKNPWVIKTEQVTVTPQFDFWGTVQPYVLAIIAALGAIGAGAAHGYLSRKR